MGLDCDGEIKGLAMTMIGVALDGTTDLPPGKTRDCGFAAT